MKPSLILAIILLMGCAKEKEKVISYVKDDRKFVLQVADTHNDGDYTELIEVEVSTFSFVKFFEGNPITIRCKSHQR